MIKTFLIVLVLLYCSFFLKAQKMNNLPERGVWNSSPKEVKVGNKMPDVSLGQVINNKTGKTKFSQFKGKLVILDFWNSSCKSCIAAFPEMEELQKRFANSIQIFLVNPQETWAQIKDHQNISKFYLPQSLPSIVNATNIEQYFPSKGETGYHIWIDGNGSVRLRGNGHINTYSEKIEALLAGDSISYISDESVRLNNENTPLYKLYAKSNYPITVKYSSSLSNFSEEYNYAGTYLTGQVNPADQILRNAFFNKDVVSLFLFSLSHNNVIQGKWSKLLNNQSGLKTTKFEVADPSLYSRGYLTKENYNDKWLVKNTFCYEQITPVNFSDSLQGQFMFEDLNRYFTNLYDIEGVVENRTISCYIIISNPNAMALTSKSTQGGVDYFFSNGKEKARYKKWQLKAVLKMYTSQIFKDQDNNRLVIDETEVKDPVDIELPKTLESVEELKKWLSPYGLNIIREERTIPFLIIRQKKIK